MDRNHQAFLKHLEESKRAVWKVAGWLSRMGHDVRILSSGRAERHKDWWKFADRGDLEISLRIEVKHVKVTFTCRDDYPYREMVVCAKHSFDRTYPKPFAYIYLSKNKTAVAIVYTNTRDRWTEKEIKDKRYKNFKQICYMIDPDLVYFYPLSAGGDIEEILVRGG